jgi:hypothetical protein
VLAKEGDHLKDKGVLEDNIRMNLQEVGWAGMNWVDLAEGRDRWQTCGCSNELPGSIKCGKFLD